MQVLSERTPDLHYHVYGVGQLVHDLGRDFGLDADQLDELLRAAELHDVGKLGIPDAILDKPGPLDDEEWRLMRQHSAIGERILNADPVHAAGGAPGPRRPRALGRHRLSRWAGRHRHPAGRAHHRRL